MNKVAMIAGSSGLTGGFLLKMLLEAPEYREVIAYVRKPTRIQHPKLREVVMDWEKLDAPVPADDVFCCLGTTIKKAGSQEAFRRVDYEYPLHLAELQLEGGSQQFLLVSAIGADASSSIFYSRVKGELEDALQKLGYKSLHIFQPSFIAGPRKEKRVGERIGLAIFSFISPLFIGPLKKYAPIPAEHIARAMYRSAQKNIVGCTIYDSAKTDVVGR
ncbi:MAG: oxidoreductase [Bacteroidota bacterium]